MEKHMHPDNPLPFNLETMTLADAKEAVSTLSQIFECSLAEDRTEEDVGFAVMTCLEYWQKRKVNKVLTAELLRRKGK
jgi:hypothetical protein